MRIVKIIKNKILNPIKHFLILIRIKKRNYYYIRKLLNKNKNTKLELGEIKKRKGMEDWITIDRSEKSDLCLDLTKPLLFPDNSVNIIYSSHLLEHFSYPKPMINLLNECYRILKPKGIFSVCVPNARIYVNMYLSPDKFNLNKFCRYKPAFNFNSNIDYLNYMAYMDGHHKYMFDEKNLLAILKKVGFKNVKLREFNSLLDKKTRRYESIYAQGIK